MSDICVFNSEVAAAVGIDAALILEKIRFWTDHNRANGTNFRDGRTWVYNSIAAWQKLFPYLSADKIRRTLKTLAECGLLLITKDETDKWNKTNWYALTEDAYSLLDGRKNAEEWRNCAFGKITTSMRQNHNIDAADLPNRCGKNAKSKVNLSNINSSTETTQRTTQRTTTLSQACAPARAESLASFVPPSTEEVAAYCAERGSLVDAKRFVNYYASIGWLVGKTPMRDWKAAVRAWERNEREQHASAMGGSSFDTDEFFNLALSAARKEFVHD